MGIAVTVYDGARCIGGNKILLEFDGRSALFDFGINYKTSAAFYDSFLKSRDSRGVFDYVEMGMLPRLKLYDGAVTADYRPTYDSFADVNVDCLFISHAHMDHIGLAGFLRKEIPFVATPMTATLMKCLEDTAQSSIGLENVYVTERVCDDGWTLASDSSIKEYRRRRMVLTERSDCEEFLGEALGANSPRGKKIEPGECSLPGTLGFETRCFPVDHSIYGAAAHAVLTEKGWVVYTGDLRTHGGQAALTERFIEEAAKLRPYLLIIEGTRTSRDEEGEQMTENDVFRNCLTVCQEEEGIIIADFGTRNFERLETFAQVAQRTGRELVVTFKDAYFLRSMKLADGKERMDGIRVLRQNKGGNSEKSMEARVLDSYADNIIMPVQIRADPSRYIVCFSIWDMPHLLDIMPQGGLYLYSGSGSFDEKQDFDFGRLDNWIRKFQLKVVGFQMEWATSHREREVPVPRFTRGYHASGHASKEELVRIIDRIRPEYLVPVHTENPTFFKEGVQSVPGERIILPEQGVKINIGEL